LKAIMARLKEAKSPVILPAFTIARFGLKKEVEALLAATGIPFAATSMDKGVISEVHPLYLGMYAGDASAPGVRKIVEGADLVLNLGGMLLSDLNTYLGGQIQASRMLTVWPDRVELNGLAEAGGRGPATFGPVHIKDVLTALVKEAPRFKTPAFSPAAPMPSAGAPGDSITYESIYFRVQQFLAPGDISIVDPSTAAGGMPATLLPDGADFQTQSLWGCIGWGTPAAFGAALAAPSRRVILVSGDGGHQLTANQIGAMRHYGVNLIILLVNNGIFGVEEVVQGNSDPEKIHSYAKAVRVLQRRMSVAPR
jgi:indolepyruvate decarboxylase